MVSDTAGEGSAVASLEQAICHVRDGKMVVVCDDDDHSRSGLVVAAESVRAVAINFTAKEARGLICLALTPERCEELDLELMAASNGSAPRRHFTLSIEARLGLSTRISAADRTRTVRVAIDSESRAGDLLRPGHAFSLKAQPEASSSGSVRPRPPSTWRRFAGLNQRASFARSSTTTAGWPAGPRALLRPSRHRDGVDHRPHRIPATTRDAGRTSRLDPATTALGEFVAVGYHCRTEANHHVALVKGDVRDVTGVLVRVHPACLSGDAFHSRRCRCREHLESALTMIEREGLACSLFE
jgi:3,4-dihydroxy 2-butanone 4-phosphate synthase / GTP cyclohydrolase II